MAERGHSKWVYLVIGVSFAVSGHFYHERTRLNATLRDFATSRLNRTLTSRDDLLFFNRVPKSGSTFVNTLLLKLSPGSDFECYSYRVTDGQDTEIHAMSKE